MYRWEWLKWVAFVAMVCDHLAVFLLLEYGWLRHVGAFAFPVFCLTVGFGLALTSKPENVAARLVVPSVVAQLAWFAFLGVSHVNVLGVFMLCASVLALYRRHSMAGITAGVLLLLLSGFLEGGPFGVLFVGAGYAFVRSGDRWPALALGAAYSLVVASPLVAAFAVLLPLLPIPSLRVPRVRGLLLWGYPVHLVALGFARWVF